MPTYYLAVYECDHTQCEANVIERDMALARTAAAEAGWEVRGKILCMEHRTYRTCLDCNRPMRPWQSSKKQHPGTVAPGSKGKCSTCSQNDRMGAGVNVRLDNAVESYLSKAPPRLREVFDDPRPLVHEARKVAPEDLWPILGI